MTCFKALSIVILSASFLYAQDTLPPGTIVPIRLDTVLDSGNSKAGQVIVGTIPQDVPLPLRIIPAGTRVTGHVVQAEGASSASHLGFAFDRIQTRHEMHVRTSLRSIASAVEVRTASYPLVAEDGFSVSQWTTKQVGGDIVYGAANTVEASGKVVGRPVNNGVLAKVSEVPGTRCRGTVAGNDHLQALWVFSSVACGPYGFGDTLTIEHAGRSNPVGSIFLESSRKIHLEKGTGMLLRILPESTNSTAGAL